MTTTCTTCRHLQDDGRENYVRCAWFDGRPLPIVSTSWVIRGHTLSNEITRKVVFEERGARLPPCPVWEGR